ncbi:MAG: serine/threonine protein kinase [Myxococcales bacterium]|nr:serine/threonine protein kinase [Myxococcales bacterium]MCB9530161.1 serine/threonine protein kinase [Myxococcales bacterium]MCB9534173.1 serine/threonine protein kinase [Myxococcales bacterium]
MSPTQTRSGPLAIGSIVGARYRVERPLGTGAFSWVYKAVHVDISSLRVAIKVLRPELLQDAGAIERFRREAELVALLRSPNTVRVMDSGTTQEGLPYIAMEYVKGETLADKLERQGRIGELFAAAIGVQVGRALKEAHAVGIIHRDLKPSNIYLVPDAADGTLTARVLDFGIAKVVSDAAHLADHASASLSVHCTPRYASPELLRGSPSPAADIYALGITLIEALDGAPPYDAGTAFLTAARHLAPEEVPLGAFAAASRLAPVLRNACAKSVAARYESVDEMVRDIETLFGEQLRTGLGRLVVPTGDHDTVPGESVTGEPLIVPPTMVGVPAAVRSAPATPRDNTGVVFGGAAAAPPLAREGGHARTAEESFEGTISFAPDVAPSVRAISFSAEAVDGAGTAALRRARARRRRAVLSLSAAAGVAVLAAVALQWGGTPAAPAGDPGPGALSAIAITTPDEAPAPLPEDATPREVEIEEAFSRARALRVRAVRSALERATAERIAIEAERVATERAAEHGGRDAEVGAGAGPRRPPAASARRRPADAAPAASVEPDSPAASEPAPPSNPFSGIRPLGP